MMAHWLAVPAVLCLVSSLAAATDSVPDLCIAGGWVLQEQCSPSSEPQARTSPCCSTMQGLNALGCFCHDDGKRLTQSLDLSHLFESCGLQPANHSNEACRPDTVVDILEDSTASILEDAQTSAMLEPTVYEVEEVSDDRPVLDLSSLPDRVTTMFQSSESGQITIRYSEVLDGRGDSIVSVDLNVPETDDADLNLQYKLTEEDPEFEEAVMDFDYQSTAEERQSPRKYTGKPDFWDEGFRDGFSQEEDSLELSVNVPEGFFRAFNDSDVTIDMDYDPAAGGSFSAAAITLDDNVLESSFTGQAIGKLLEDAAWYLSSEFSIPLAGVAAESNSVDSARPSEATVIGGALNFLAAVGEDIRDSIPRKALHDGDVIQIQHEEEEDSKQEAALKDSSLSAPRHRLVQKSRIRMSENISSKALQDGSQQQVAWMGSCCICIIVHKYIAVLWSVVFAGALVLIYCAVTATIKAMREGAPTDPNAELKEPLIVYAAEFAKANDDSNALLLPVWSPPKALQ